MYGVLTFFHSSLLRKRSKHRCFGAQPTETLTCLSLNTDKNACHSFIPQKITTPRWTDNTNHNTDRYYTAVIYKNRIDIDTKYVRYSTVEKTYGTDWRTRNLADHYYDEENRIILPEPARSCDSRLKILSKRKQCALSSSSLNCITNSSVAD